MSKITKLIKDPKLFVADAYRKRRRSWSLKTSLKNIGLFIADTYKKRSNAWFLRKSFTIVVTIPFLITVVYYLFLAADRYVSESIVAVRQTDKSSSGNMGLAAVVGFNPTSKEDTLYLREYIRSTDIVNILKNKINLKNMYEKEKLDLVYRLYSFMSQEDFLEYYRGRVDMVYDDVSGLLKINAEAFNPTNAKRLADEILRQSELFVNELSHSVYRKQLEFAENEMSKAETRLTQAKNKLLEFQNRYGTFNPIAQAQSQASLVLEFEKTLSKKEAELSALSSYLQNNAPQILALKREIAALKEQIKKESDKVAAISNSSINLRASEYQTLTIEAGFAEELYKLSLQAVEQARIESIKQIKYLAIVQNPSAPDSAKYPRKIYNLITTMIVLLLLYGITQLIKVTIEDHKY